MISRTAAIRDHLAAVHGRIADAAHAVGRNPSDVRLLLAAKGAPTGVVRAAVDAGATLLGENRGQELTAHAPELADRATFHLIGRLQSNKVNAALDWVACVQSVADADLAERLSRRCQALGRDLDVMIQVNVTGEPTKQGTTPDDAARLAEQVGSLPGLHLTGFMTIGALSPDPAAVRAGYALLRKVRDGVVGSGRPGTGAARELSMGMSGDLELAIAEGATMVRVGTAVFGVRPAPPT